MGVRLTRVVGKPGLPDLDPFLMLDEFRSDDSADYIGGFPDHPHRGFETITYMLAGRMRHSDNQGNSGVLGPGSVQWMTAGRGIVHSEMPEQQDGLMWGFQLWLNLPAREKMTAPKYKDIAVDEMPSVKVSDGVAVKIIAGRIGNHVGPVTSASTDPTYFDVALAPGASFTHALPENYAAFVYVFDGDARIGDAQAAEPLKRNEVAVLTDGGSATVAAGDKPTRVLLAAGRPLNEPIAKYGPFVMNTEAELMQAVADYQAGRF
ncbi:MAG: pirin family protein [Alphaproteobacteria bacterium]